MLVAYTQYSGFTANKTLPVVYKWMVIFSLSILVSRTIKLTVTIQLCHWLTWQWISPSIKLTTTIQVYRDGGGFHQVFQFHNCCTSLSTCLVFSKYSGFTTNKTASHNITLSGFQKACCFFLSIVKSPSIKQTATIKVYRMSVVFTRYHGFTTNN